MEASRTCFAAVQAARADGRRARLLAYAGRARALGPAGSPVPGGSRARNGGETPCGRRAHRYRWSYVGTFVEPETGESLSLLVDGVDTEVMGWVLRELQGLGWGRGEGGRGWFLDRAGWHVSGRGPGGAGGGAPGSSCAPSSPELQPVVAGVASLVTEAVAISGLFKTWRR
jgi:hypothetical protein